MSPIIEIKELSKRFGKRLAVDNISFNVESGEIFGLVGPNGAGKTTTMRMLVTLLKPDKGEIFVDGYSIHKFPNEARRIIGFMPDSFGVYGDMTTQEYLDFFGSCYKIPPDQRARLISDLLDLVDLGHRRDDMVDTLSRGLKQRLGLARVLIHDPCILVLDEPASGTRVGILEDGKLAALGTLEQLNERVMPHRQIRIGLIARKEEAQAALQAMTGVSAVRLLDNLSRASLEVDFVGDDEAIHKLLAKLLEQGFPVVYFSEEMNNLEEVFMRATKGIVS
jgi:ABC-2 type transport system ATP-binding protein